MVIIYLQTKGIELPDHDYISIDFSFNYIQFIFYYWFVDEFRKFEFLKV